MRKFFVLEAAVCQTCGGFGAIDNQNYQEALERLTKERKQLSKIALEAAYGPEVLPCPAECDLGVSFTRVKLTEALDSLKDQVEDIRVNLEGER